MKKNYLHILTRVLSLLTTIAFGFLAAILLWNIQDIFNPFFLLLTIVFLFILTLSLYHLFTGKYTKLFIFVLLIGLITIILDKNNYIGNKPFMHQISSNIKSELEKNNWTKIDFSKTIHTDFDRVCIFGPYINNESVEHILGFKWNIEVKTNIQIEDGHNVIVFVKDNQVIQYVKHPRNLGDFSDLSGKCFDKYNSKLERTKTTNQWIHLNIFTPQTNKSTQETSQ